MLDDAGLTECKITASNALDEKLIRDLMMQGAQVDTFGVGERLITSSSSPVFGGVYKLVAVENAEGDIEPKIKVSENAAKITNLSPTSSAFMTRLSTIPSPTQYLTPTLLGKPRP